MKRLVLALVALLLAGAMPALAQTCSVSSPGAFNFGSVDVLANTPVDISGTVSFTCTGTANRATRLCLNLGDPNAEAGGTRVAKSGANQIRYDIFSDAGRTTRWSNWKTGTGAGVEVLFTFNGSGSFSGSVPIYGRVFGGQQSVPSGDPSTLYKEAFTTATHSHQRADYVSTGKLCPTMTTGTKRFTNMTVSIRVPKKCLIFGNTLDFGTVTSLAGVVDASTNLSVTCSAALPYTIGLGFGLNGTTAANRKMSSGSNDVNYMLYRNATRTLVWGNTVGTDTLAGTGSGLSVSVPVYGRVPAQTTPPPATYVDSVVVTVTY